MLHTIYRLCVVCGQMSYCIGYSTARGDGVERPMPLERGGGPQSLRGEPDESENPISFAFYLLTGGLFEFLDPR